jgi:hypothetical protein
MKTIKFVKCELCYGAEQNYTISPCPACNGKGGEYQ